MNNLNFFFFGEEEIGVSDALYFYGTQLSVLGILAFLGAITLLN